MEISKTNESNYVYIYIYIYRSYSQLIQALLYVRKLLLSEGSSSTQQNVARRKLLHREAFRRRCVCTEQLYTQTTFSHGNLSHREAFIDKHSVPCTHRMATECTKYFPVLLRSSRHAHIHIYI